MIDFLNELGNLKQKFFLHFWFLHFRFLHFEMSEWSNTVFLAFWRYIWWKMATKGPDRLESTFFKIRGKISLLSNLESVIFENSQSIACIYIYLPYRLFFKITSNRVLTFTWRGHIIWQEELQAAFFGNRHRWSRLKEGTAKGMMHYRLRRLLG